MAICSAAAKNAGISKFEYLAGEIEDVAEVMKVMGGQAAYITKLMDTKESLKEVRVQEETRKEYNRMAQRAFKGLVELQSIPDNAYVVKAKLLISIKNSEAANPADQSVKARLVAMGNVIFDKNLKVRSSLPVHDLWAPVCSMTGVRVVQARVTAHRRKTEGIDLVAAYTQVRLGGDIRYFMIIPKNVVSVLDPEVRAAYEAMGMPVVELGRAVYGLGRSGQDFIGTFAGWLNLNAWYTVPEEPASRRYPEAGGGEQEVCRGRVEARSKRLAGEAPEGGLV